MRRIAAAASLLTAALLVAPTAVAGASGSGAIAYTRDHAIHIVRADGTGDRVLVRRASSPAWSPDGRRLAYVRGRRVYVTGANGRSWDWWGTGSGDRPESLSWSPDGRRLAWLDELGMYTWKVGKPPIRRFLRNQNRNYTYAGAVAWRPGGPRLSWTAVSDLGLHLDVDIHDGRVRGALRRRVIVRNGVPTLPWGLTGDTLSWSPDGRTALTTAQGYVLTTPDTPIGSASGPGLTAAVDAATGTVTLLPAVVTRAAWAPNGRELCGVDPSGALVVATPGSADTRAVAHGLDPDRTYLGAACAWRPRA